MINNTKKFNKFADIIFDGRTKSGKPVKKIATVGYYTLLTLSFMAFSYMILELLVLSFIG